MADKATVATKSNFRHFFVRGLVILLPSVLTIWILIAAYGFVQYRIAAPINVGVKSAITWGLGEAAGPVIERWDEYPALFDLIGLAIAIILIYSVGAMLGSLIGARLYARAEQLLQRLPLIRQVYPSVKQVTEFLVGGAEHRLAFSRVVALQYPRQGIWSLALVTGTGIAPITSVAGEECLTLFVPSSPTPFTGYMVTVRKSETVDMPLTIEEAIRMIVSGGVLVPPNLRPESTSGPGTLSSSEIMM